MMSKMPYLNGPTVGFTLGLKKLALVIIILLSHLGSRSQGIKRVKIKRTRTKVS